MPKPTDGILNSVGDPFMYVANSSPQARGMLASGRHHSTRTWWHESTPDRIPSIVQNGLLPGCWLGSGECAVFGLDHRPEPTPHAVVVEVQSPAPLGDVKAWWVPPSAIMGVWVNDGGFLRRAELMDQVPDEAKLPRRNHCRCPLSQMCAIELESARQNVTRSGRYASARDTRRAQAGG